MNFKFYNISQRRSAARPRDRLFAAQPPHLVGGAEAAAQEPRADRRAARFELRAHGAEVVAPECAPRRSVRCTRVQLYLKHLTSYI